MKYKIILEEGKEATISAENLGDAHVQAVRQWGVSVSGIVEWKEPDHDVADSITPAISPLDIVRHFLSTRKEIEEFIDRYSNNSISFLGAEGGYYLFRIPPHSDLFLANIAQWPVRLYTPNHLRECTVSRPGKWHEYAMRSDNSTLEDLCETSADWEVKHRKINTTGDSLKYDSGKLRYDLLPIAPIEAIVRALEHGAIKYGINSWRGLKSQETRLYSAALRHLTAWKKGERIDPESRLSHLAHAACNLIFMLEFEENEK